MGQLLGVVYRRRRLVDQLGKWVIGMFKTVHREGRQRFALPDDVQPTFDRTTVSLTPSFDVHRALDAPQDRGSDRREKHVVLPVVHLDEPVEAPHGSLRLGMLGIENRFELPQSVRRVRFGTKPSKQGSQHHQLSCRLGTPV